MSLTLVHSASEGSAASEAALWDEGIQAMLEARDQYLWLAEREEREGNLHTARQWRMDADDLSAECGIQQFRLLAFMLANGVRSADLIAAGAE